jgi:ferredoxin-fold anticodon binding domain-containing protein
VNEELLKTLGQQLPIKTRSGSRHLDYVVDVKDDVVVLATNQDGSGRRTILALREIESFTTGMQEAGVDIKYR